MSDLPFRDGQRIKDAPNLNEHKQQAIMKHLEKEGEIPLFLLLWRGEPGSGYRRLDIGDWAAEWRLGPWWPEIRDQESEPDYPDL